VPLPTPVWYTLGVVPPIRFQPQKAFLSADGMPVPVDHAPSKGIDGSEGVTELEAADAAEVPLALAAVTVNVYATLPVSPETVIGLDALLPVKPPGDDVAVYDVAVAPKILAVKGTVAVKPLTVTVPVVGTLGIAADAAPLLILKLFFILLPSDSLFDAITKFHFRTR